MVARPGPQGERQEQRRQEQRDRQHDVGDEQDREPGHGQDCSRGCRPQGSPEAGACARIRGRPTRLRPSAAVVASRRPRRRPDVGLAVDEDPRGEQPAARPQLGAQVAGQGDQQAGDQVGHDQVERAAPAGQAAAPDIDLEVVAAALAALASTAIGSVSKPDQLGRPRTGRRRSSGSPSRSRRRGPARPRTGPRPPSARSRPGTAGSWGGGPSRRPSPDRGPGPRHRGGGDGAARWAG